MHHQIVDSIFKTHLRLEASSSSLPARRPHRCRQPSRPSHCLRAAGVLLLLSGPLPLQQVSLSRVWRPASRDLLTDQSDYAVPQFRVFSTSHLMRRKSRSLLGPSGPTWRTPLVFPQDPPSLSPFRLQRPQCWSSNTAEPVPLFFPSTQACSFLIPRFFLTSSSSHSDVAFSVSLLSDPI